ncbi:hypothetical protein L6452_36155 [Arctium lappa]|uniref:Uncharacterized protein n=2 Tax=Arctium lappa TaxID=4217 RepID=A0ACB8Y8X8_ARCLA|nr:hypothetical protein L6452_36154 [Arctium lappa]KAI3681362.1 hypothetical protein L6452_36155 [Arctium lappa]
MDKRIKRGSISGAIIPALMHRIPSELRSQACLGESSTRMGDPLGSPRVAPLFGAEIVCFWLPAGVRSCFFTSCRLVGPSFSSSYRFFFVHGAERGESPGQAGPVSARRFWERPGRRMDKRIKRGSISVAIIPALMHRIPSELRS